MMSAPTVTVSDHEAASAMRRRKRLRRARCSQSAVEGGGRDVSLPSA